MDDGKIIQNIRLYLFDMDGTLYLGDRLFDFTKELLRKIRQSGADYLFMTNNSSKSVSAYIEKLARLGIRAVKEDFITSSQATAYYLKKHHPNARLYVCGTQSLKSELCENGFTVTERLNEVDAVVMGFDTELTFRKLEDVCKPLLSRDLPYIATNPDYVCPTEYGAVPDCGSVCDMIYSATKKRPTVIGKPQALMPQLAMEMKGVSAEQTAVVGDRIDADMAVWYNREQGIKQKLLWSGDTMSEQKSVKELPACPVETTLTLIGDKWKVLIMRDLLTGTKRFGELKRSVGNVSQKVLTAQLRAMEESGLLTRTVYAEVPPRVVYTLTDLGQSLKPILDAMQSWGEGYKASLQ